MNRPSDVADGWIMGVSIAGGCAIGVLMAVLFGALVFSTNGNIDDGPSPEPAVRPTSTIETATPSDLPEEEEQAEIETVTPPGPPEEPDIPEEEKDDTGGTGDQDSGGQVGVQFGSACAPVGALGVDVEGRPAECFMGSDGRARWGYDSDRG